MSAFCMVTGPSFLVASVGIGMLGSTSAGWRMVAAHHLSALVSGFIFSRLYRKPSSVRPLSQPVLSNVSPGNAFMQALSEAGSALLAVGCTMGFFGAIIEVLSQSGTTALLAQAISIPMGWLGLPSSLAQAIIAGVMEMTAGCKAASESALPLSLIAPLCTAMISFGGLSVQMQALYFLKDAVSKRTYFLQRFMHGALSFVIAWLIFLV